MSATGSSAPVRTCIGCRTRRPDNELIRITVDGPDPVIGVRGSGGRGAWLCPDPACIGAAGQSRAFSRSFRTKIADVHFADRVSRWLGRTSRS